MPTAFPHLFQPLRIGGVTLRNRIMSTGHDTVLPTDSKVNAALIAYHRERARGGAGLIVLQVSGVHETARYTSHALMATDDDCIDGYRQLATALHAEGCAVFGQLFHPGREIMETADGLLAVAYAPSAVPNERFHVQPRVLTAALIADIVAGYAAAARRMAAAGIDGVEVVASHGYLPSQFLNPRVNLRQDDYGGDAARRLRFLQEVLAAIRAATPAGFVIGLRISGGEMDAEGLSEDEAIAASVVLQPQLDYVNVIAGTSASLGGAVHIVPPMAIANGYLAPVAARFKARLQIPVLVAGRINQPQEAEQIIASGQADVCGMTRALICDPEMPRKAGEGRVDDIRACIACNQACIGRFHRGLPISCIQHPQSGRELRFGQLPPAGQRKRVLVVGGGPAGMKAAVIAAQRGHQVALHEAGSQLGGQALLAQQLPGRAEFGGLVTNLQRELQQAGVEVHKNSRLDAAQVLALQPDAVIVATGATPRLPPLESDGSVTLFDPWQVLRAPQQVGRSVVVVDWRSDWIGPGIALLLAQQGCQVRLAVNSTHVGEQLPLYVRDELVARLHKAGIEVLNYMRPYGADSGSVYLQHTASEEAVIIDAVDSLVLCSGHTADDALFTQLAASGIVLHAIGDCLAPRTAEEAIYEGLCVAWQL